MPSIEEILRARNQQNLVAKVEEDAAARERKVSSEKQLWHWVSSTFSQLPRRRSAWYKRLWADRLLHCDDVPVAPDTISDYTTRLLCAAIQTKQPLLVVLPDGADTASTPIVATVTILHSREDQKLRPRNRLLYIGNHPGMRYSIHHSRVEEEDLSALFPHTVVSANLSSRSFVPEDLTLTELVYACRPANVNKLIQHFRPDAILIDITGPEPKPWFAGAIEAAKRSKLPVVAWCNSHLNPEIELARSAGWAVFSWCARPDRQEASIGDDIKAMQPGNWSLRLDPTLIYSPEGSPGQLMVEASKTLYHLRDQDRPIVRDARALLNRTLRALSRLAVPLDYYEEESKFIWGLYPVKELLRGATRFVEVTSGAGVPEGIEHVRDLLGIAYSKLESEDPPLWRALTERISRAGADQLIVFPNVSSCSLFMGAVSRYLGFSLEEIEALGLRFSYFKALTPEVVSGCSVTVVGVPSSYDWPRMWPLSTAGSIEVLHYPHEFSLLSYHVRDLSAKAAFDLNENLETLALMAGKEPVTFEYIADNHFTMAPPSYNDVGTETGITAQSDCLHLLPDLDPAAEWERLLPDEDPQGAAGFGLLDSDGGAIVEDAVKITFTDGRIIFFDGHDSIQTVLDGELREQQARAISPGDTLLIIDGQRRQNLYSLIVARLHDHPAVRIHLNLVERWWQEVDAAYDRTWRRRGKPDAALLEQIQSLGSRRVSVQAVQSWVRCLHCPEDPEDMRRVAEVLDMPFSRTQYKTIHKAAQRIHSLHRNISRRLNDWLQQRLEGYSVTDEILDGIVDDEFHLTLRDFQDSIAVLEVLSVESLNRPISRSGLGTLFTGE